MEQLLKSMTLDFFGKGKHKITPEKLFAGKDVIFLDVRSNEEFQSMRFPLDIYRNVESVHIPIDEIPDRLAEIPRDKLVGIFCPACVRATIVYVYLRSKGYVQVRVLEGGYAALTDALKPGKILSVI